VNCWSRAFARKSIASACAVASRCEGSDKAALTCDLAGGGKRSERAQPAVNRVVVSAKGGLPAPARMRDPNASLAEICSFEMASHHAQLLFSFTLIFCGVLAQPGQVSRPFGASELVRAPR
jgi:hypothetical protein